MQFQEPWVPLDPEGVADTTAAPTSTRDFLMRCVLGAREESGFPSNEAGFDEDVNVYLVGLLERFLQPSYHHDIGRYLRSCDIELAREVRRLADDRHTYRVYRTNADHLLLAIGLFHHVAGAHHPGNPLADRDPATYIGRGGTYYHLASSSLRRLRRRTSGPEVAMSKLGGAFAEYADVLRRVRSTYFHLTARLGEGVLYHLSNGAPPDAETASQRYDAFLDAYSAWNREGHDKAWETLREAVEAVRGLDPDFAFQMPERPAEDPPA